jgi:hypothetical protein
MERAAPGCTPGRFIIARKIENEREIIGLLRYASPPPSMGEKILRLVGTLEDDDVQNVAVKC